MPHKIPQGTVSVFVAILGHLPANQRHKLVLFFFSVLFLAALETLTVAAIAVFATAIADPETVFGSRLFLAFSEAMPELAPGDQISLVYLVSVVMIALMFLKNIYRVLQSYLFTKFTADLENLFGERMIEGFLYMPYQWHLSQNSADLQYTLYARTHVGRGYTEAILQLATEFTMVAMLLCALLLDEPVISLCVMAFCIVISLVILKINKPILDRTAKASLAEKMAINSHATKAIHGIKDIRLLRKEQEVLSEFDGIARPLARHTALQKTLSLVPGSFLEAFGFLAMVAFVWILLGMSDASPGSVLASVTLLAVAAWRILPAVSRMLNSVTMIRNTLPDVQRVLHFLRTVSEEVGRPDPDAPAKADIPFNKRIALDHVTFAYEGAQAPALDDVSFEVGKNQTLGIIGRSGAGKSTLVDVLVGFFEPAAGSILIDDTPLTPALRPAWLRKLGYVPQFPYICHGSLAENVAFGMPPGEIDRERVRECCRMANIDFLDQLPDDIDTFIGERGVKLSGGQLQRVAIARALYPSPEVVIFDEATSALDRHAEQAILKTIFDLTKGRTVLIIAHNMETVVQCDTIVWLESGAVRAQGKPDQVIPKFHDHHGHDQE